MIRILDPHNIAERAKLLSHRIYAAAVDANPDLLTDAVTLIDRGISDGGGTIGHYLWQNLLKNPWRDIKQRMLEDTPEGRLLRSNSPFSHIIGVQDTDTRIRIWQLAKAELCSQATCKE